MNKYLKWTLIIAGGLIVALFVTYQVMVMRNRTKSPPGTAVYEQGDLRLTVDYSRPSKRGRTIFGDLVPYGDVWRTGANEATLFTTSQALRIDGQPLPAGTYALWTIPGEDQWAVIFNQKEYSWGINFDGSSPYDPSGDVVTANAPRRTLPEPIEQFTVRFAESPLAMVLEWDDTQVNVPLEIP